MEFIQTYTTQSVLKIVYNLLFHSYIYYAILNWVRGSKATIQPLIKLQNKAVN